MPRFLPDFRRSGPPPGLLQLDGPRKEHVVLQMHVTMEIALETIEVRHADRVGRAPVRGCRVPISQLANDLQIVRRVAMLAFHHPDWIFDGAERTTESGA